jgi:hypothetical protein
MVNGSEEFKKHYLKSIETKKVQETPRNNKVFPEIRTKSEYVPLQPAGTERSAS